MLAGWTVKPMNSKDAQTISNVTQKKTEQDWRPMKQWNLNENDSKKERKKYDFFLSLH